MTTAITKTISVENYDLQVRDDGEPMMLDSVLAERLGYARADTVRDLIVNMLRDGKLSDDAVFRVRRKTSSLGGRPADDFWLTEAATLKVTAKAGTKTADRILDEVTRIFIAARKGLLVPVESLPIAFDPSLTTLVGNVPNLRHEISQRCKVTARACGRSLSTIHGYIRKTFNAPGIHRLPAVMWPAVRDTLDAIALGNLLLPTRPMRRCVSSTASKKIFRVSSDARARQEAVAGPPPTRQMPRASGPPKPASRTLRAPIRPGRDRVDVHSEGRMKKKKSKKPAQVPAAVVSVDVAPKVELPAGPPSGTVLCLRTVNKDMRAVGNAANGVKWDFLYPRSGIVECPDWSPTPTCGNGLHALAWGDGDWSLLSSEHDAVWMVIAVDSADLVTIDEKKIKFRCGNVVFAGAKADAIARVLAGAEAMDRTIRAAREWGEKSGNFSTAASSGNSSTAASSGNSSTAASSGDFSTAASSGYFSTAASSGNSSTAASSGYSSKAASSGNSSKAASSGNSGIAATIGNAGMAKAGERGLIVITYWVDSEKRYRACVGNVGEDGILADTWYRVVDGKLVVA